MSASMPSERPTVAHASDGWPPGPAHPVLSRGAVHVWRADLALVANGVLELLSTAENARAARLASDRARLRWSRSRGVLRALLGRYLGQEASALVLAYGENGKPELPPSAGRLFFNLSHSGDLALYAFSATGPVGVDVQLARDRTAGRRTGYVAVARRAFGQNAARHLDELAAGPGEQEFLRLWTRHEAELKSRGSGIGAGVRAHVDPPVAEDSAAAIGPTARPWIVELDVAPCGAAALASRSRASEQRRWSYA